MCNPKLVKVGLDLLAFPTIIYVSIPKSTEDLRQSSRRSHRLGQTVPVRVVFLIYPTMEKDLLRLMAQKMKASLMVEGKLPGEGLVSFGEEEGGESETDMFVQLARQILANIEADRPREKAEEARELQELFEQNARIEREKQQTLGHEGQAEPVEFEPVREVPLPPEETMPLSEKTIHAASEPSPTEKGVVVTNTPAAREQSQPIAQQLEKNTPVKERKEKATKKSIRRSTGTVTIIHTAVTTGHDPWAELRAKHIVRKSRRKQVMPVGQEELPNLWMVVAAPTSVVADKTSTDPDTKDRLQLNQQTLW